MHTTYIVVTLDSDIEAKLRSASWFHSIDLGSYTTKGRFDAETPPNYTLFPVYHFLKNINVTNMDCIDIGTMDGIVAFILKARGARRVIATDLQERKTFNLAREALSLNVEYLSDVGLKELEDNFPKGTLDLVVMSGVIYHIFSPLTAISTCRKLLKRGGLLIVETSIANGSKPVLKLNTEYDPPVTREVSTFWVPTKKAVDGMLKFSSFDVIASADTGLRRVAYLAKAVAPSEVSNRTPLLIDAHTKVKPKWAEALDFNAMENRVEEESKIVYSGSNEDIDIDVHNFSPDLPFQPSNESMKHRT